MHELKCEIGFRITRVALAIERLAVEIAELDHVRIDNGQLADARPRQGGNDCAADTPCPDHGDGCGLELSLTHAADLRQDDVSRVTVKFFVAPKQMADLRKMDVLWFMLMDCVHHRGQFSVYLRMADGKVPSIYGPSGDEPWM